MNKVFFYTAYIFAVIVFFAFFAFMLWQGVEMTNQMHNSAVYPTFWTTVTDIGLFILAGVGLFLSVVAAYIAFVRGYETPMPKTVRSSLSHGESSLPAS